MAKKDNQVKEAEKAQASSSYATRGNTFEGTVVSAKATKTVTVEWEGRRYVPKYERYEKRKSKIAAHNPEEIGAAEGDLVRISETRPISKTKHFIVTDIIKRKDQ